MTAFYHALIGRLLSQIATQLKAFWESVIGRFMWMHLCLVFAPKAEAQIILEADVKLRG